MIQTSSGGTMMAVLIENEQRAINITDIAQRSGVPTATAARTVTRLADAGLVTAQHSGRQRLVQVDTTSPYYEPAARLAWIDLGAAPSHPRPRAPIDPARGAQNLEQPWARIPSGWLIPTGVPDQLRHVATGPARDRVDDGPALVAVRSAVLDMEEVIYRNAYALLTTMELVDRWEDPTDRERFAHLRAGRTAMAAASMALTYDATRTPHPGGQATAAPARTRSSGEVWTFATYAIAAEAAHLQGAADTLADQVDAAGLWARPILRELETLAAAASGYAARMAQAPCVSAWQHQHPDAAARHHLPDLPAPSEDRWAQRSHLEAMLDQASEQPAGSGR